MLQNFFNLALSFSFGLTNIHSQWLSKPSAIPHILTM
jgi:hypothetical protein